MSVATLTFQFPEDEADFRLAVNAHRLAAAIERADQACRSVIKYHENPSEDALRLAREVRALLAEATDDPLC